MSGKCKSYLLLQLKRGLKLMPQVLIVTLLLALCAVLAGLMLSDLDEADGAKQKIEIGVVGDTKDTYLNIGLYALEHLDSSRFSVRLQTMEEQEARTALYAGRLTGYLVIPEDFVEGMVNGDHHPITYVTSTGATGFGTIVAEELASDISRLLLETENAIYGAQAFTRQYIDGVDPYDAGQALVERYMRLVLNRNRLFEVETIGTADSLSPEGYYLCGMAVAMLLLWGISCSPLISRRSNELCGILNANGLEGAGQILSEFAAFFLLMLFTLLCVMLLTGDALWQFGIRIPELSALKGENRLRFCLELIPVGAMLSALSFFLYELLPGTVGGILLQFLNAVAQGYLAGCFYPSSFLPEGMRMVGNILPAGVAMGLLKSGLGDRPVLWRLLSVLGYTILFLLLSAAVRRHRLRA